jgi:hypothetical protein
MGGFAFFEFVLRDADETLKRALEVLRCVRTFAILRRHAWQYSS